LQCFAVCCSVLQCVAVCCSVLQCVAVCCSVLRRMMYQPHIGCCRSIITVSMSMRAITSCLQYAAVVAHMQQSRASERETQRGKKSEKRHKFVVSTWVTNYAVLYEPYCLEYAAVVCHDARRCCVFSTAVWNKRSFLHRGPRSTIIMRCIKWRAAARQKTKDTHKLVSESVLYAPTTQRRRPFEKRFVASLPTDGNTKLTRSYEVVLAVSGFDTYLTVVPTKGAGEIWRYFARSKYRNNPRSCNLQRVSHDTWYQLAHHLRTVSYSNLKGVFQRILRLVAFVF